MNYPLTYVTVSEESSSLLDVGEMLPISPTSERF